MNNKNLDTCDKCNTEVIRGKCFCGYWFANEDPRMAHFQIFKDALIIYNNLLESGVLPPVFSNDLADENIQSIFFKGTIQETEMLKDLLKQIRSVVKKAMTEKEEING